MKDSGYFGQAKIHNSYGNSKQRGESQAKGINNTKNIDYTK